MSKKLTSTLLLFAVFIGFFLWGAIMLFNQLTSGRIDGGEIIYSLMILGCGFVALGAILQLPRKKI